jgi:hypothetical protein
VANTVLASTANSNMVDRPIWLQAKGGDTAVPFTGQDLRGFIQAMIPGEGVLGPLDFRVTQNGGGDGTVNVAAGNASIDGDGATNLGAYFVRSIGTVNLAVPSAGAGVTRTHRVIIRVRDSQLDASTTYDWTLEVLEDTGSGTPAQPNSAITLALVSRTGSNAVLTANVTDSRTIATVAGNQVARGVVGGTRYNGGSGSALVIGASTTEIALNMTSGSVTLKANRRFRLKCWFRTYGTTTAAILIFRLRETNVSGTVRATKQVTNLNGANIFEHLMEGEYVTGSSDETKTFVLTGLCSAGTYNIYNGDSLVLVGIEVEDVGPSVPNVVTVV